MKKKILLSLGAIAAAATPLAVVVSCGDKAENANSLKAGSKFEFKATNDAEAKTEFNKVFKDVIATAAAGFVANADKGKNTTGSVATAAISNPMADAKKELTTELNGKTIVKVFTKGNNTLFLLKDGTTKRQTKADVSGDMQLTYPDARKDDNDSSKATAGLMADFGNTAKPNELHDALLKDEVTSVLGFYNFAQQETSGVPYVHKIDFFKGLYTIQGNTKLVNSDYNTPTNVINVDIVAGTTA